MLTGLHAALLSCAAVVVWAALLCCCFARRYVKKEARRTYDNASSPDSPSENPPSPGISSETFESHFEQSNASEHSPRTSASLQHEFSALQTSLHEQHPSASREDFQNTGAHWPTPEELRDRPLSQLRPPGSLVSTNLPGVTTPTQPQDAHQPQLQPLFSFDQLTSFDATGELTKSPCPICLEPLAEQTISCGQCLHFAHASCLREWLARDEITACPVCRVPFTDDVDSDTATSANMLLSLGEV